MSDTNQVELPILEARRWSGAEWPSKRISIADSESGGALMISARYVELDDAEDAIQEVVRRCNDYKQLQARVKELEAINLGLTKTLVEMEAENAELRNRGAVYYGLQKDEGRLLMNVGTEQLEIYDSLRAAQRAVSTGQKIIQLRVRRDDEGKRDAGV